ncbi:cupin domain-containing protein [Nocardia sp. NPDC127526]|uniref:cupin domain-containing protein n=1 Tax=Nocardia sp. NPDC127526 TaxID=3345393 RepID=UPI00363252DE
MNTRAVPFSIRAQDVELSEDREFPGEVIAGNPRFSSAVLWEGPTGAMGGVWQVEPGVFTWEFPADELFVVLDGKATIEVEGGPVLTHGPGDMAIYAAGDRTVWRVHETLRKVFHISASR